jgi:predicted DNA-binding transcriptional regulator AlpA
MDKSILTLNVSELRELIAETLDLKLKKFLPTDPGLAKPELPKFLTRQEVASLFRVSLVTIDKWRRFGRLPRTIKQSGRTYFLREEIEKLIDDKIALNK